MPGPMTAIPSREFQLARVILFTVQVEAMSRFYGEVIGLKQVADEKSWKEFDAGGARIALHSGPSFPGRKGPKIVFYARVVARGASLGKVRPGGALPV